MNASQLWMDFVTEIELRNRFDQNHTLWHRRMRPTSIGSMIQI